MDQLTNDVDNLSLNENQETIGEPEPVHEANEAIIVHPNGQTQVVKECWCRMYHVFGNQVSSEHVNEIEIAPIHRVGSGYPNDDIYCMSLREDSPFYATLPFHIVMFQKFSIRKNGPVVFYKKGFPLTIQETQNIFN